MKNIVIGILAHVDAGKTTLSESILYLTGKIRKQGRVDHGDAFLDTDDLEKERGITIFSKQAVFAAGDMQVTLLDTPGHVDFSAEMERTLSILDAAVLVINGADGVQGHTRTLWRLLCAYRVPVFLFVNKMDQEGTDETVLLKELGRSLDEGCVSFHGMKETPEKDGDQFFENIAVLSEEAMEQYLEKGELEEGLIAEMVAERKVFPCYFGAALRNEGVKEFLEGIERYAGACVGKDSTAEGAGKDKIGAKVFKISRDSQGNRLTHLKVTEGSLRVKDVLMKRKSTRYASIPAKSMRPSKKRGQAWSARSRGLTAHMPDRESEARGRQNPLCWSRFLTIRSYFLTA